VTETEFGGGPKRSLRAEIDPAAGRTTDAIDLAYFMRSLEQALRAGNSLRQAIERVSHDMGVLETLAVSARCHPPPDRDTRQLRRHARNLHRVLDRR
jgi:hypothetical protein